jgi:hypothetical protein
LWNILFHLDLEVASHFHISRTGADHRPYFQRENEMQNALYKVEFQTPLGAGAGVVFLQDGKIHGGDSAMFYVGKVSESGDNLTAEVEGKLHTNVPPTELVFGVSHTHIILKGKGSGNAATLTGTAKEAPGVAFQAKLTKICD